MEGMQLDTKMRPYVDAFSCLVGGWGGGGGEPPEHEKRAP